MKFIIVFGPQAVGKMTVGHEIEKLTGLHLFHNHMTIDLVHPMLSYGTDEGRQLVQKIRNEIFSAVAASDVPGLIFTFLWNFDSPSDREYIEGVTKLFEDNGATAYWVELEAEESIRLERNRTEHRLKHKPSKRDVEWSEKILKDSEARSRHNSHDGEVEFENYIRINNADLPPEEVARRVVEKFNL